MSNNNDMPRLSIKELFDQWNIPEDITNNFIGNEITLQLLKQLSPDVLKELCQHILTRIILQQHINQFVVPIHNNASEEVNEEDGNNSGNNSDDHPEVAVEAEVIDEVDYFPSLDLTKQITASPEGPLISADYSQNGKLNPTNQQSVVDIISRFLFPWLEENMITSCHYRCLLKKIKKTFPNECLSVYFIKPVPKRLSPSNKPIPMRGKLPDKIRNTRHTSGITKGNRKRKSNNPGDIETEIEKQRTRAYNKHDTVQPYILIQGNMTEHNQVLLVVDEIKYQFTSAITACDCLFKCYHVFGAQYPKDSNHIYLLIQRCLFKIKTQYDVLPTTIIDIDQTFDRL
ncbi:hypothetical protein KQX54_013267 [Cotesia glomerata]|uniref:Uncharacterized protein n=1 Tax=Cotesia glomerata TaxID=32391 RepID=A0AAV7IZ65_COTGL|nr:hypothetical protein KQX54_013267 [Cotesia glomerata]